ncbi:hypothetical protein GQ53DRAFT_812008 [Thozetella sp. PMI_491]|nr:hypothetical protein GQ53DRAFT_812008 [Thozetella sp. PMI_491]
MAVDLQDLKEQLPPSKSSREQLIKTHRSHLKKQDLVDDAPRPVKQPVMSEAYPASARSIKDLEIIPLSELRLEIHHRGKGLVVRAITPPYISAGSISIVEDGFGNVDKLAIYNQPDSSVLSALPEGCVVAVKEPYYKDNGGGKDYMICVDHPSDVIFLRFSDPVIPESLRMGPLLKSAKEWKDAGDKAFIEKDLPTAVFCYTEAIEASGDDAFASGVYAKRAGVNLVLGRYDAVQLDALASCTGAPTDWRAYFTAGRAAYGLCDYKASKAHFESALRIKADGAGLKREYERCLARLREEDTGNYDFPALYASLNPSNVHLDVGSFVKGTEVRDSAFHGRGIFAARDFKAGDLIFAEKAALMPNQYEPARASAALYAMMGRQLSDNPSLAQTVFKLHPGDLGYAASGLEGTLVDGVPVVDIFMVEGIRTKNCFSAPLSTFEDTQPHTESGRMSKGLWAYSSYMNHSCVPNSMRSFLGDLLISRAVRDIRKGEELFQQYVPVKALVDLRQKQFMEGWGFECRCRLCEGEKGTSEAALEKRKEVLLAVEKACVKKNPSKDKIVPDSAIRTVDRLAKQLEDLHEPEVYENLPRLALIYPNNWLIEAHRGRKNHSKVLKYGTRVVRNFGFYAPDDGGEADWDPMKIYASSSNAALMTIHVVTALRYIADAYAATGREDMAKRCVEAAEFGYAIITGYKNDLSVLDI